MSANHINSVGMESLCNSIKICQNSTHPIWIVEALKLQISPYTGLKTHSNNGKLIAKLWLSGKNGITSSSIVLIDAVDAGLLTKKSSIYFK